MPCYKLIRPLLLVLLCAIALPVDITAQTKEPISRHDKLTFTLSSRSLGQSLETELTIAAQRTLSPNYSVNFVDNPERLVIDLPDIHIRTNRTIPIGTSSYVSQMRLGTHPEKLRIVLDLIPGSHPAFVSKVSQDQLTVTFRDSSIGNLERILTDIGDNAGGQHRQTFTIPALRLLTPSLDKLPASEIGEVMLPNAPEPTPNAIMSVTLLDVQRVEHEIPTSGTAAATEAPSEAKQVTAPSDHLSISSTPEPAPSAPIPVVKAVQPVTAALPQVRTIAFGFLGPSRIPVVQIKLSEKVNYTFSKEGEAAFKLLLDRVSPSGDFILLPQFPPQEFNGLIMVSAARPTDSSLAVIFTVEDGVRLIASSDGSDLLIRAVTR